MKKGLDSADEVSFAALLTNQLPEGIHQSRYGNLVNWYILNARRCKTQYYMLTILSSLCSAGVIIATATKGFSISGVIIATLTALSNVAIVLVNLLRSRENWVRFRISAESLKSEACQYLGRIGVYEYSEERDSLFLSKIEEICILESKQWPTSNKMTTNEKQVSNILSTNSHV